MPSSKRRKPDDRGRGTPYGAKAAEEAPADAAAKAAEDCPASSWPGPDGKCSKNASILSSKAPDKTLGVFGNAKFSARGPRPRFQHMLMILGGRKSWL